MIAIDESRGVRQLTLEEIRTSKLKPLGTVLSGIDKRRRLGRVFVSSLGLADDEHDLTFHGGIDKAVHQYCPEHYPRWRELYPEAIQAQAFVPGGFGENLVARGWNEGNVCVGDLVEITHPDSATDEADLGCLLEVSIPRQPCFKLNQRFQIKNFAPKTHELSRTGWYYRVKREGWIEEGMKIRIVKRKHPRWTIEQLHHYVHRERNDLDVVKELMTIPELGNECKDVFIQRWQKYEQEQIRLLTPAPKFREFKVVRKSRETPRVVRLVMESVEKGKGSKRIPPGSNALIKLSNGLQRAYSVVDGEVDSFSLGIARDDKSRGGSTFIHDTVQSGDSILVGPITHNLELDSMASHHIFIVGGIGITAFLAMMTRLSQINQTFELHNCVRSPADVSFSSEFAKHRTSVRTYDASKGERLNISELLKDRAWNSAIYVCGPQRMIDAVLEAGRQLSIPENDIHYEKFKVDSSGDPFTADVDLGSGAGGRSVAVGPNQSLMEALREAGFNVPSSCETGSCGTCRISLLRGQVEHKGTALTEAEKEKEMLACVSRGVGHITVSLSES